MSIEALRNDLENELPAVFTRTVAEEKTGGMVTATRLRDLDSAGEGPQGRFRMAGNKVGYRRTEFVEWFVGRVKSLDTAL